MGRRRKNDDFEIVELIAKLGGFLILLLFLAVGSKNFTAVLQSIVVLAIGGLVLIGVVIVAIILIKKKLRSRNNKASKFYKEYSTVPSSSSYAAIPRIELQQPEAYTTVSLIEKLRSIDWFQFEKLVGLVYEYQEYEVERRGGANPDGGIDLVIEKDDVRAGIQCKQWKTWNVGVKPVREFLGALTDAKIQHGIFITLNGYTSDAKQLAEKHGIELINETGFKEMLEKFDFSHDPRVAEILDDERKFCPKCEREMVLRTAGKGLNAGNQFWGCSGYPRCKFTMQI